jgi:DNA transposition AAA+ family ATPase
MIPAQGPLTTKLREEILQAVVTYMHDGKFSQSDVARAIGTSTTYINNLLSGTGTLPDDSRDSLLRDLNNWLDREVRAKDSRRSERFVETTVARRMMDAAERLKERSDMALAYGPAGIGKSMTARAIEAETRAIYVMIDDDCRAPGGLRCKIYNATVRRKRLKTVSFAQLVEILRMPDRINVRNLLIIDEAQDLYEQTFTTLRKLHEQADCSILFLGTIALEQCLSSDDDPELGQLSSRVGMRINLARELSSTTGGRGAERLFSVADIRALFHGNKIKLHASTARMLATIANSTRGTLRRVERLVYWATKAAQRKHASHILPEHVQAAARVVGEELGVSATDVLADASEPQAATA